MSASDPFVAAARRRRLTCDDCGRRFHTEEGYADHRWAFHFDPQGDDR